MKTSQSNLIYISSADTVVYTVLIPDYWCVFNGGNTTTITGEQSDA